MARTPRPRAPASSCATAPRSPAGARAADLFDFAITEDCGTFDECDAYTDAYAVVLDIEYATGDAFADLCAAGAVPVTAIRRDLGLVAASAEGYEFERCAVSE